MAFLADTTNFPNSIYAEYAFYLNRVHVYCMGVGDYWIVLSMPYVRKCVCDRRFHCVFKCCLCLSHAIEAKIWVMIIGQI